MGNLCSTGIDRSGASSPYDTPEPRTPERQGRAARPPGHSPLQGLARSSPGPSRPRGQGQTPLGTPTRPTAVPTPLSSVERRGLQNIERMVPMVNDLLSRSYGVEGLGRQYEAATLLQQRIESRLGGNVSEGGADDFSRRIRRIEVGVDNYYAHNPDTSAADAHWPHGSMSTVTPEVLQTASNMLLGFETFANLPVAPNSDDVFKVSKLLVDLAQNRRVHPAVIKAAQKMPRDPQALVDNLMNLVKQDPQVCR